MKGAISRFCGTVWLTFWKRKISFVVSFLATCLITFVAEMFTESILLRSRPKEPGYATSVSELSAIYQWVVAARRTPTPRHTAVIVLDPVRAPTMGYVCGQREYVSRLIRATASLSPAVIVVDKYFEPKPVDCASEDPRTLALLAAFREVNVPTIVGRRIADESAKGPGPFRLLPALKLAPQIKEGIINVDPDARRLPLGWMVFEDRSDAVWRRPLSLEAALAQDPGLLAKSLLQTLTRRSEHPYIAFLAPHDVQRHTYSSQDVICASTIAQARDQCPGRPGKDPTDIKRRVVIIGEDNRDQDAHLSVVGMVPGFVLHMNYIEALLDDRYFMAVPSWVSYYVVGFLIYLVFQLILVIHHIALRKVSGWLVGVVFLSAILCGVAVIVGTVVMQYLTMMFTGWYVDTVPVAMGLFALAIKFLELLYVKFHAETT